MALAQEIKALKADNVNLQMHLARAQKSQDPNESDTESSSSKADPTSAARLTEEIRKLGKRHTILYAISLTHDAFGSAKPLFEFDDDEHGSFLHTENAVYDTQSISDPPRARCSY